MIIQKYLPSVVCGILLGFLLDKTASNIAEKYKFSNAMRITFHITFIMIFIYIMEKYICESFMEWRNTGCGTLFFVSFFSIQVNLYGDIYRLLEKIPLGIRQAINYI